MKSGLILLFGIQQPGRLFNRMLKPDNIRKFLIVHFIFSIFLNHPLVCQESTGSEKNPVEFPKVQADIVRDLNNKEQVSEARRRIIYIRELVADGHNQRALQSLEDFTIIYPVHKHLHNIYQLSGQAHESLGSSMLAVAAYKKAFYHARDEARGLNAYLRAGKILAEIGHSSKAAEIFRHISSLRPSSAYSKQAEYELNSMDDNHQIESNVRTEKKTDPVNDPQSSKNDTVRNDEKPLIDSADNSESSNKTVKSKDNNPIKSVENPESNIVDAKQKNPKNLKPSENSKTSIDSKNSINSDPVQSTNTKSSRSDLVGEGI